MNALTSFGIICQILLYSMFGLVLFAILSIIRKSCNPIEDQDALLYRKNRFILLANYNDPLNLIGLMGILIYIFILITIKIGFDFKGKAGDIPGLYFTFVPLSFIVVLSIENIIRYFRTRNKNKILMQGVQKTSASSKTQETQEPPKNHRNIHKNLQKINQKLAQRENHPEHPQIETLEVRKKVDFRRKLWHFIVFLIILGLLLSGWYIIQKNAEKYTDRVDNYLIFLNYWGSVEGKEYLQLIFVRQSLPAGQSISIFMFYTASVIFLVVDLSRLSENMQFFLHKNAYRHIWNKEHYTIAAYTHFSVAYLATAVTLPPLMLMGVLCLGCFADPAASMIGMNWGKHPIKNTNKTWEGSIAGCLATFGTMVWFVGPIYAGVGMIVFLITDLFSPKPIRISDNLSMPILTTVLFVILSAVGITSFNLLGI